MSVFMLLPHSFDYYSFVLSLKSDSVTLFSSYKIVLAIWGSVRFHVNFKVDSSVSAKNKVTAVLIKIALNLRVPIMAQQKRI